MPYILFAILLPLAFFIGSRVVPYKADIQPTSAPTNIVVSSPTPTQTQENSPCKGKNSANTIYVKDSNDCMVNYTDCQLNDGSWKTTSKYDCNIAQGNANSGAKIDCTGPDGKHIQLTQKECDEFNSAWGKTPSTNQTNGGNQVQNNHVIIPTYTNTYVDNSITCFVSYPCTGNSYTYRLLPADCTNAQQAARNVCNTSYGNNYNYALPTSTPYVPQMTKNQCISNVNDKYGSQMRSQGCYYPCPDTGDCGSTSVCEALWHYAQQEMSACNQYP
jgi:hypothetical protein